MSSLRTNEFCNNTVINKTRFIIIMLKLEGPSCRSLLVFVGIIKVTWVLGHNAPMKNKTNHMLIKFQKLIIIFLV